MRHDTPEGLSDWAKTVWASVTAENVFADHEVVVMRRALGLWDRSDATFALADAATDSREAAKLARLAIQLADAALKAWKVLKFPTPEGVRRPGRPSGDDWSEARKVAAAAREQRF